jgi:type I restriction-modification system DNA methylase subunit
MDHWMLRSDAEREPPVPYSTDDAKRLGERLKERIFLTIFPQLAQGFLMDRKQRLGLDEAPTEEELADMFEATLTLLYRLLFLLHAEGRDLLPICEAPYHAASLKKIKEKIAEKAGVTESRVAECLQKAYSEKKTTLYDRLGPLFRAVDKGDPSLNVPTYNGGLFNTSPDTSDRRDRDSARFLLEHKVPDRYLALAIDRLARDQDERTLAVVFIDYKSLNVRHLGSIYEALLEFKLKVADEDLTTQAGRKGERYIPLSKANASGRRKPAGVVVSKGQVYLSNDKAERKASGSYYTPDAIVEYIIANTVGPVLEQKLEALRPEFHEVCKTLDNEMDHRQWAGLQTYNTHKDLVESLFDLRVLDPAMGSGHFLVETVHFVTNCLLQFLDQFPINPLSFALNRTRSSILESLGEQGVTVDPAKLTNIHLLKRHVLQRCIYGVDLDPMAVELAKVSLWLDASTLGAPLDFLDHHLRCGNSLIGATFADMEKEGSAGFDCVVGNPPYISFGLRGVDTLDSELRKYYVAHYPRAAQYKIATYALFVEKCLALLRSSGRCGLLLPDSFLLGKYFEGLRRDALAQGARVLELLLFQQSFWGDGEVGCPVVLLANGQIQSEDIHLGYIKDLDSLHHQDNAYHSKVPTRTYATTPRSRFYFFLCDDDLAVYRGMMDKSIPMSAVVKFYSGLIGKAGQASIVFEETQARATGLRVSKLIESGSFLQPFAFQWSGKYIVHSPSLYKSGYTPAYYENPKLFLNQTGDHPKACVDEQGFYCLNNMHVGYPLMGLESLYFVAGVLNSKFGNAFYRFLSMESGRAMAQLDIDVLDLFPLPGGVVQAFSRDRTKTTITPTNLSALRRVAAISHQLHRPQKETLAGDKRELVTLLDDAVLESYQVEPGQFEWFAARRQAPFAH